MFKKIKTYSIEIKCYNCGKQTNLIIPFGMRAVNFVVNEDLKCNNCGCYPFDPKDLPTPKPRIPFKPLPKNTHIPEPNPTTLTTPTIKKEEKLRPFFSDTLVKEEWQ